MADDTARLRAILSSGQTWDDPSEDLLFMFFEDIDQDTEQYFIVERVGNEQFYIQTILCRGKAPQCHCVEPHDGERWTVERREGDAESHWAAFFGSYREAHEVLFRWCRSSAPPDQHFAGRTWDKVTYD